MEKRADVCEECLNRLGFEILDLGTDFNSAEHLYYVMSRQTGVPLREFLLTHKEIEQTVEETKEKKDS